MANQTPEKEDAPTVMPMGHKNPPVGPKTGQPVPEWRKTRDYEQFMPTPNQ